MKNAISISIAFCLDFLIRNENITHEGCKTENCFKSSKKLLSRPLLFPLKHFLNQAEVQFAEKTSLETIVLRIQLFLLDTGLLKDLLVLI